MNWFIQDYDEITIFISNGIAEYFIPKFRISMTVDGDELTLKWNDRERGGGGDQRSITMDYLDVVDGYGGYLSNPSSALQLQETLEAYIISGWTDITSATSPPPFTPFTETSDFTLNLSHYWSEIEADTASTINITVPPDSDVAFPIGTTMKVFAANTGVVAFVEGVGVTIKSIDDEKGIISPYGAVWLTKTGIDEWYLDGDLTLAFDPDALLYINANGTLTEEQAILWNDFVLTGKDDGWWDKAVALYPFIGGTAATHKWNAKNPVDTNAAFRLVFTGSPTHNANGVSFNGTTQYADTFIVPFDDLTQDSTTMFFSKRNSTNAGVEIGSEAPGSSGMLLAARNGGFSVHIQYLFPDNYMVLAQATSVGRWGGVRTSSTVQKTFKDASQQGATDTDASGGWSNLNYSLYLGGTNSTGSFSNGCASDLDFAAVLDGLTDGEYASFDAAVLALNTGLGR